MELSRRSRSPDFPGAKQAEQCLLFRFQTDLARADDPQMPGSKIGNRSPVEILIENGGTHVRRARNPRSIAELLPDSAHHCNDAPLPGRSFDRTLFRKSDRRSQRSGPGAEVFRRELLAEVSRT
jgi:hypothetical protein